MTVHGAEARWRVPLAGVAAAVVALAVAELVAVLASGGRSLLAAVGDAFIRLAPAAVVELAIELFGAANRLVLLIGMAVCAVLAGALLAHAAVRRRWAAPLGFVTFALLGAAAGAADPLVPPAAAVAAPAAGTVAGLATLWGLLLRVPEDEAALPVPAVSRRAFLTFAVSAAAGAVALAAFGRVSQQRTVADAARRATALPTPAVALPPPPADASFRVDGLSPLLTPNDRFYRIDTALAVPRLDADAHRVRVTGLVDRPFDIGYAELLDLADSEADVTLACVSNEVGGTLVGNARWQGMPLATLLGRAGVRPEATQIVGRAVDGWTAGFPVEAAFDGRPALVAVGMNGEVLPNEHGFPVRLVIAGLYGYVSDTKWLSELELTTFEAFDAYWVRRGWARHGPIKTQSRIDVPRPGARLAPGPIAIAGVAWAGERGVSAVEVAVDGVWHAAEVAAELSASSWRQWRYRWDATTGDHELRVRATDGDGSTQVAEPRPPQPDGATGHHTIRVRVT